MVVRIGVLGAARITRAALLCPAARVDEVQVVAVAARDPRKATGFARRHGIPIVHTDYDALLADPHVDAVYIPLPNALHGRWAIAAIEAGKHVLVEKPFAANGDEAQAVADAASRTDLVVMEAFHSLYHPLVPQLRELLASGAIGTPVSAEATFCVPIPPGRDIRWSERLGGGALMDAGCYPLRLLQGLFGYDATVLSAHAAERDGVDRTMVATLALPGVPSATVTTSMWSRRLLAAHLTLTGDAGALRVRWPYQPQVGVRIRMRTAGGTAHLPVDRTSTYLLQLRAFRDAVLRGAPPATTLADSVAMMRVVDDIYVAAGMRPRLPV